MCAKCIVCNRPLCSAYKTFINDYHSIQNSKLESPSDQISIVIENLSLTVQDSLFIKVALDALDLKYQN